MACINTLVAAIDYVRYHRAIEAQELHPEPVIILGHPRTGTTHLHNLLAQDPQFAFATTFQAGEPKHSFTPTCTTCWLKTRSLRLQRPSKQVSLTVTGWRDSHAVSWFTGVQDIPAASIGFTQVIAIIFRFELLVLCFIKWLLAVFAPMCMLFGFRLFYDVGCHFLRCHLCMFVLGI